MRRLQWLSLSLVLYFSIYYELFWVISFHAESRTLFEITYGHALFMLPAYN